MTKNTQTEIETTATQLPSPHVDHSAVLMAELEQRLMGFDAGIALIAAEVSGMKIEFDQETAELQKSEKERQQKHADNLALKARLTADLERARGMVMRGQQAYRDPIPSAASVEAGTDGDEA